MHCQCAQGTSTDRHHMAIHVVPPDETGTSSVCDGNAQYPRTLTNYAGMSERQISHGQRSPRSGILSGTESAFGRFSSARKGWIKSLATANVGQQLPRYTKHQRKLRYATKTTLRTEPAGRRERRLLWQAGSDLSPRPERQHRPWPSGFWHGRWRGQCGLVIHKRHYNAQ
jgi:hypothetical protein